MKIFRKYTSRELIDRLKACCARFPLALFFFLCLTVTSIIHGHRGEFLGDRFFFFSIYYPATAAFLSLSLHLWCEEMKKQLLKWVTQISIQVLWLAISIYFSMMPFDFNHGVACIVATLLVLISIFLLSFYREKNDIAIWNFAIRIIISAIGAAFVCSLLSSGINLLLLSFQNLFGLSVNYKLFPDTWIVCMFLLAPILFLLLIPQGEAKHDRKAVVLNRFGKRTIHFLFIPLLASYLIVLYVYVLKIIFTWTLPCGWVSWLVSVLMLGMVAIIILLYPSQFSEKNRFDKSLMRYLPLIVLPLLLLMTVGAARRVGDYGITVWRLYLIAFNVWCYFVCIVLFLNHSKRIWWIPASFGVLFFALSVGPQSMANVTRTTLLKEVSKTIDKSGIKHRPLNNADYKTCIARLDTLSARRLDDKLDYLESINDRTSLSALIDTTVVLGEVVTEQEENKNVTEYSDNGRLFNEPMKIPTGYSKVIHISEDLTVTEQSVQKGIIPLTVEYEADGKRKWAHFELPLSKMKELDAMKQNGTWILNNKESALLVESFYVSTNWKNRSGSIAGLLFLK